eukprot:SAG31_NODE_418_length_15893_cov_5.433899_8_plen_58_part_00
MSNHVTVPKGTPFNTVRTRISEMLQVSHTPKCLSSAASFRTDFHSILFRFLLKNRVG